MSQPLIWLHEQALYLAPYLTAIPNAQFMHIWDDDYYQQRQYTLKRLVFIYESLCESNIPIIAGNTLDVIHSVKPTKVYIPNSQDSIIQRYSQLIARHYPTESLQAPPLTTPPDSLKVKRFFKYWHTIKHQALQHDGGQHG